MMPRNRTSALAIGLSLLGGFASAEKAFGQLYIEGSLSVVNVDDASTIPFSWNSGGLTFSNFSATVDYDAATAFGVELGYYVAPSVRVSLSYNRFSLAWNAITVDGGSISDGTTTISGSATVTRSQLGGDAAFDNDVSMVMLNAYYDFPSHASLIPYIGIGLGRTSISNAINEEDTISITLGVNYDLGSNNYMGARYTQYHISGPTDQAGYQYKDVTAGAFSITFTHRF